MAITAHTVPINIQNYGPSVGPDLMSLEPRWLAVSPYLEQEHLLDLTTLDVHCLLFALSLTCLEAATDDYAIVRYENSLNLDALAAELRRLVDRHRIKWRQRDFYVVEFRSRLKESIDNDLLFKLDKESHREATESGGLLKYWYGVPNKERRNLATCFWRHKEDAIKGGLGPWHKQARAIIPQMYEEIHVIGLRLTIDDDVRAFDLTVSPPSSIRLFLDRLCNMSASRLVRPALAAAKRTAPRAAIRSYATPATPVDAKPPVPLFGLDGTYASALYTAAVKQSALEPTAKAISSLQAILKSDPKVQTLIAAPTLQDSDKAQIIDELEKHTGGADKTGTVKNFLQALAENNRLGLLESVTEKFGTLISAAKGELELTITTAQPLDGKLRTRLETAIQKSEYSQGKKLKVVTKVSPDILGGLVVEIGERTIDYSVANKISRLNKLLTEAV
ncbi:hypothetical protein DV736_g5753, partial [Chaetothyriales sp. CBS 134916]